MRTILDGSILVFWSPGVVLDAVSWLVGGLNVEGSIRVGRCCSVNSLPCIASQALPKVLPLKVLLVRAKPFLGRVSSVGGDEGGHLGQVRKVGQGSNQLSRVVFPFQGKDDPLHAGVEALHLGVEPFQNVILALKGGEEVKDAEVECEEGGHSNEEKATDVEGSASLGSPDVAFPDREDITDQGCLVAHLMEG